MKISLTTLFIQQLLFKLSFLRSIDDARCELSWSSLLGNFLEISIDSENFNDYIYPRQYI